MESRRKVIWMEKMQSWQGTKDTAFKASIGGHLHRGVGTGSHFGGHRETVLQAALGLATP